MQRKTDDPYDNWKCRLPKVQTVNREDFFCNLVKDKTVLHIGCADHEELIDNKIKNSTHLHTKLVNVASKVNGIDVNRKAIQYLKNKYKIGDLYYCDITRTDVPAELLIQYDVILVPEVIEHVNDLGIFLKAIKRFMNSKTKLVIGTPNAYKISSYFYTLKGYELNNPDHKYYFTYSTLKRLIAENGFADEKWHVYIAGNPNRKLFKYGCASIGAILGSIMLNINSWFGDGIIVQANLKPDN